MLDKNLFTQQLSDLSEISPDFDILAAKYNPLYKNTAMQVEKLDIGYNVSSSSCLNLFDELSLLNENNYNIYIRPSNYRENRLIVLDDFISSHSALTNQIMKDYVFQTDLFSFDFALSTSNTPGKNKTVEYNYQLGLILNENINPRVKQFFLKSICENLDCDPAHATISKYFRVAGFVNKKYNKVQSSLEEAMQKNILVQYYSFSKNDLSITNADSAIDYSTSLDSPINDINFIARPKIKP